MMPWPATSRASCLLKILPRQAREKLHAMRRLVVALKKRQQWDEARRLEKEVFDLTGASPGPQFEAFMIKCGNAANEAGNYTLAELYARQAITEATKRVGEHSMANSTALDALGFSFCQRSRYKEALPCHRQAVRIAEDLLEPSDPILAARLSGLGVALDNLGQFDESIKIHQRALSINLRAGNMSAVSANYRHLGYIYLDQHKFNEARSLFNKALEICLQNHGKNMVAILTNIGDTYFLQGDADKALEYYKKSLACVENEAADRNPDVEIQWTRLGDAYLAKKNYAEAQKCFEEGLKLRSANIHGERYISLLRRLISTANKMGKTVEANAWQQRLTSCRGGV